MSKKVAALNMFNDKKNGRFVFLIENRACLPSVKLSSVDVAIIYDSDWNPLNDLRALQRVTIESQFEHVKVFRLYSSCTVEEKVLIFAKKDMILESNIQNISPTNSHMLLSWGAFYLFSKLDEFHQVDNLSNHSEASIDLLIVNDAIMKFVSEVMFEVLTQLPGKSESCSTRNCSVLVKAMQSGASYSRNISLIGEKDGIASLDKDPPSFWSNLLENRCPMWRFVSDQSQRSRKRPQHFDVESKKVTEVGNDETRRKHRKLSLNTVDPITWQNWLQDRTKGTSVGKDSMVNDTLKSYVGSPPASISPQKTLFNPSNMLKEPEAYESQVYVQSQCKKSSVDIVNDVNRSRHVSSKYDETSELHYSPTVESERRKQLRDLQRSLHLSLKPDLDKLCDVLKLPEEVKSLAQTFLEYIMNNHQVSREPKTTLQAFKISLCWRAASFLKHKVDHRECLALAKKYLNFVCDEEQAASVYSKLRMLKKQFSQTSSSVNKNDMNSSQNHLSVSRKVDVDQQLHVEASNLMQSNQPELGEIREISDGPRSSEQLVLEQQQDPVHESPSKIQQNLGSLQDVLLKKRVDLIHEICSKRAEDLLLKQQVEISDFNVHREEEKIKLKTAHDSDLDLIRYIHIDHIIRNNKIKLLNQIFLKKMDKYDQHMKSQRSKLAAMQEDARHKEEEIRDRWLEEAKAGSLKESFDNLPLTESGFRLEEFKIDSSQFEACDGAGNMIAPRPASDRLCTNTRETCQGESSQLVVEHPESPSLLHTERVEDMLVETEIPACKTLSMVQLDSDEPTGASVSRSNPHQISNDICTAGSGESTELSVNPLKVPSDIPSERIEDVRLDVDNIVSQFDRRVRGECVEPPGSSQSISTTLPSPTIGRLSMETEITPSQSDTISAEGNVVDAVLIDSVMGTPAITAGTPAITADRDLEGGDNIDNTHLISSPQQIQAEVQSDISNAVSTGSDPMLIASTPTILAPTSVGWDTHEGQANRDISCLIGSLQKNQAEFAPSLPSLTSSGCDVLVTSNPISSVCEHERHAVSGATRPDQGDSSSQQIAIPVLDPVNGVPSPVKQTTHNTVALNPTLSEVPASVDISLTENCQQNNVVPLEYEGEPCTLTNSFAPQTEVSLQQPISGAAALGEQTNQFVSSPGATPLPLNSGTQLERTRPEHLAGGQSEPGSQVSQLLSWLAVPVLGSDPLENELTRIRKQDELCTKKHDAKKVQLELERDQEIERIRRKYEVLLQDAETEFVHDKKILETVYNKVLLNRILAEEFRAKFIENKGSAASFPGPRPNTAHQFLPASHTPRAPRQSSTSCPTLTPNSANLPVLQTPGRTPSTRPPIGPRAMASVSPCPMVRNTPFSPTNQFRSNFSPVLPPRMNHQLGTEARAPAPHLVRFRPPSSTPVALPLHASQVSVQQQPVPNPGSATIVAPITPTPRAPLSGTYYQPVVPAASPVSHSATLSAHRLPRDADSSGADMPNLSQSIDVGPSLDGLLPTNLPPKENEPTPSSSDASRAAAAAAAEDVVCISDEE
ncbi:uncharacterized protein M6B38_298215 [Iris pallida]|uniref:MOM1 alpha-helical domain-containing protein n=1 Tax=Iris pallida TaxID=29817 RepID=A0AAX6HQC2_IRIPA|nr:uncharacterized protein M6B38_298215 [Iris pallida]